jgi:hypothetical protein
VSSLIDHNSQFCLVCNTNLSEENSNETSPVRLKNNNSDLFGKIGQAMKLKSQEMKGKLFDYIVNPSVSANNSTDKKDDKNADPNRRERMFRPVFSIDDDQDLGKFK